MQNDASRPVIFWSELDGLRHQETSGVAMAWKWEMRTEGLSKIEFADWHWRDITYRRKPRRCHAMAGATVRPQQMDAALVVL